MKTIRASIRCMTALAALTLWVSFAADIDGKWTGQVQGRRGPQTQTLTLKAVGQHADGQRFREAAAEPVEISNGTIDGDNVSFTVVREFGDNKVTQEFKGTLSGGELKLTVSGGRGEPAKSLTRRNSCRQ